MVWFAVLGCCHFLGLEHSSKETQCGYLFGQSTQEASSVLDGFLAAPSHPRGSERSPGKILLKETRDGSVPGCILISMGWSSHRVSQGL